MDEETRVVDMVQLLNETIVEVSDLLRADNISVNDRKAYTDEFEKLYKLRIEEQKLENDFFNEQERRTLDKQVRQKEVDEQKALSKAEIQKTWIEVGKAGVALAAWLVVSFKVMKFEETGSIRSKSFTGTIPKLKFW